MGIFDKITPLQFGARIAVTVFELGAFIATCTTKVTGGFGFVMFNVLWTMLSQVYLIGSQTFWRRAIHPVAFLLLDLSNVIFTFTSFVIGCLAAAAPYFDFYGIFSNINRAAGAITALSFFAWIAALICLACTMRGLKVYTDWRVGAWQPAYEGLFDDRPAMRRSSDGEMGHGQVGQQQQVMNENENEPKHDVGNDTVSTTQSTGTTRQVGHEEMPSHEQYRAW